MGLRIYSSALLVGFIYCLLGFIAGSMFTLHAQSADGQPLAAEPAASMNESGVDESEVIDTPSEPPAPVDIAPATANTIKPTGPVPLPMVNGFNFSLNQTGQHSSVNGWSTTITPDLSYTFNRRIAIDFSTPWVQTDNAIVLSSTTTATPVPAASEPPLTHGTNLLGDSSFSGHFFGNIKRYDEFVTGTLGIPTGNTEYGLSANQPTFNITNHIDHGAKIFTADIEFGIGDSSSLVKTSAKKTYTAVGPLANFQAGSLIDLPLNSNLDIEAYEDLPIGNQNVYGTITRRHRGTMVTTQILEGSGLAEDNGVTAEYDIPIKQHMILSGSYQRSLRQNTDIVAVGVTFFLRTPKKTLIQMIVEELR